MDIKKLYVHDDEFHSDDVLCAAMVSVLNPAVEIIRSSHDLPGDHVEGVMVADVGRGKYDHHDEKKYRKTGEQYAAAGLVFDEIKGQLFHNPKAAEDFENLIIKPIEASDNGIRKNALTTFVNAFRGNWNDPRPKKECYDEQFKKAVSFMTDLVRSEVAVEYIDRNALSSFSSKPFHVEKELENALKKRSDLSASMRKKMARTVQSVSNDPVLHRTFESISLHMGKEKARSYIKDFINHSIEFQKAKDEARIAIQPAIAEAKDGIIILPKEMPWSPIIQTDNQFVIWPSTRDPGFYNVQVVPEMEGSYEAKINLPKFWKDVQNQAFDPQKADPECPVPEGLFFVHPAQFFAVFDTLEHALDALSDRQAIIRTLKLDGTAQEKDRLYKDDESQIEVEVRDVLSRHPEQIRNVHDDSLREQMEMELSDMQL